MNLNHLHDHCRRPRGARRRTLAAVGLASIAAIGPLGQVAQAFDINGRPIFPVSSNHEDFRDLTAAHIKSEPQASLGGIALAFTTYDGPEDHAGYGWIAGSWTSSSSPFSFARRWDEGPSPWPQPSNFLQIYGPNATFQRYSRAVKALWGGANGVAVIVALMEALDNGFSSQELVLLTSNDGGQTYGQAVIVSTGTSGGAGWIDPTTVDASLKVSAHAASAANGSGKLPVYLVWKLNGGIPYEWWVSSVLISSSGAMAPDTPRPAPIPSKVEGAATIVGYTDTSGAEVVQLVHSERLDGKGKPVASLPPCPSDERFHVRWHLRATRQFGLSNAVWSSPHLLDEDPRWKACVGCSFGGCVANDDERPPFFLNSDRVAVAIHRNAPARGDASPTAGLYALSKSDPDPSAPNNWGTGPNHRVYVYQKPLIEQLLDVGLPEALVFASPTNGQDKYAPELVMHHGWAFWAPIVGEVGSPPIAALTYRDLTADVTHITGATIIPVHLPYVGWWWHKWARGGCFGGPQSGPTGVRHGLAVEQLCVDQTFGPCGGGSAPYPDAPFFCGWIHAMPGGAVIEGRSFVH